MNLSISIHRYQTNDGKNSYFLDLQIMAGEMVISEFKTMIAPEQYESMRGNRLEISSDPSQFYVVIK